MAVVSREGCPHKQITARETYSELNPEYLENLTDG